MKILKHPNYFDTRTDEQKENGTEEIIVRVVGYGESSINLKVAVWGEDAGKAFQFTCDLYKSVKERFDKEGIEIPYPHRTVIYKKESETI
jgi:small conductance mechanosensitive channel